MSAKERRIRCLAAETSRGGGVRGKSCPVKGREKLNTGQPNCAFYNVPYRITLTGDLQIAIISRMKTQIINYFMAIYINNILVYQIKDE